MSGELPITIPKLKVFLTGGTGYIGGAILTALLRSPDLEVTTLVRSESAIETLTSLLRILNSLRDLRRNAFNCASANDLPAAEALINGLSESGEGGKRIFVHTSGTSAFATYNDGDEAGRAFDDTEDLVGVLKEWDEREQYGHRTVTLKVVELGTEKGVSTYTIVPPMICGQTAAIIPRLSVQLPPLIRTAIETKKAHFIGSGNAIWSNVHITDLANLYELILRCALSGVAKSGYDGIYFASNGEKSWKDIAYGVKEAVEALERWDGGKVGLESWTVEDAAGIEGVNGVRDAKLAFGSNVITVPNKALKLGWKPAFGGEAVVDSMKKDAVILWKQLKNE
ncbi:hypothetical protein AOL_s00043g807 [Orbilia oligospora ATCC 24927]|uniref:Thioester reductase (TE) domain-containing protein n=1 Tax=Arthrobotrys oligospora (strain ATCC 24927 / CBS 115.81 / DSM 1491) TaxID=756982 RepID=G1X533_ARTOA|nr:hypothetical protein AOL_s00043g807 [Orbilia oligospora ATCC 24927]EGX51788.1 hypothetical protein AOL_s00043g807 [Orbilia oligospora ATCC 24927]